jgi:glycosyltransferase involved in cell wall biosynthesis
MTIKPLFSIITASLNNSGSLPLTIESVRRQSYPYIEHVIIDGGSTDGTVELLIEQSSNSPISWISEPDRGIADAMNKGLCIAKGRYILILHADDRLLDMDSIGFAASHIDDEHYDIYAAPVILEYDDGRRIQRRPYRPLWWYHFKTPFCHQGTIVHRRVFDRIGLFDESFSIAMDYDFFYRAIKSNPEIVYREYPLSFMGAYGVGTRKETVLKRIDEEYRVRLKNEENRIWKMVQFVFHKAYRPYKIHAAIR